MKAVQIIFFTIVMSIVNSYAQSFPKTPTPPNNAHTEVVSTISNSTSVSNSNNVYRFSSKFQSLKHEGILELLEDELDNISVRKSKKSYTWKKNKGGKVFFSCVLTKNTLKIVLEKERASYSFIRKVKYLGEELRKYISAHKKFSFKDTSNSIGEAQIRLDKAREELKRSIRNLEEVKRASRN